MTPIHIERATTTCEECAQNLCYTVDIHRIIAANPTVFRAQKFNRLSGTNPCSTQAQQHTTNHNGHDSLATYKANQMQ